MNHTSTIIKKLLAVILCLSTFISLSGCKGIYNSYREIDTLQLIQTLGIDWEGDAVVLTVSTGQGLEDQPPVAISRRGETVASAIGEIQNYSSKEDLFFAHARFVVLGEAAAEEMLPEFLDFMARSAKLKMDMTLFVVSASNAKGLLTLDGEKGYNATEGLASIEKVARRYGIAYPFTGIDVISSLNDYGSALICAITPVQLEGSVFTEDGGSITSAPAGYAIIKDGALCAYLDPECSRGATILMNKTGYGSIALELEEGAYVTVYTEDSSTDYTAHWGSDGSLEKLSIEIKLSCGLVEVSDKLNYSDSELLNAISKEMETKLLKDASAVLYASKELESDFLGLKGILRSKYPKEMSLLTSDFPSLLPNLDMDIKVSCEVIRNYDFERAGTLLKGGHTP